MTKFKFFDNLEKNFDLLIVKDWFGFVLKRTLFNSQQSSISLTKDLNGITIIKEYCVIVTGTIIVDLQ